MSDNVIGVDLGGTKVEACMLDANRELQGRERVLVEPEGGLDRVVDNILYVINAAAGGKSYSAVGMGAPGTYIDEKDTIYGVPHTPIYETPGFMSKLRDKLKVPLIIENDANCLGLAEYFASCSDKYSYVLAVIIGTGMGYGLILDNKLYRGAHGGAGEIGHTTIDYMGRLCECGRRGCAEAYLSGSSLSRRFEEMGCNKIGAEDIYKLYLEGDQFAIKLFDESCHMMGEIFANAFVAFDLEAIILGGGVSNLPIWYEQVPEFLKKSLFGIPRGEIPIIKAKMGDSAGVFGAAYLALREIGVLKF